MAELEIFKADNNDMLVSFIQLGCVS
jgi:hypothetical protein